jgi:hypothetical protein
LTCGGCNQQSNMHTPPASDASARQGGLVHRVWPRPSLQHPCASVAPLLPPLFCFAATAAVC